MKILRINASDDGVELESESIKETGEQLEEELVNKTEESIGNETEEPLDEKKKERPPPIPEFKGPIEVCEFIFKNKIPLQSAIEDCEYAKSSMVTIGASLEVLETMIKDHRGGNYLAKIKELFFSFQDRTKQAISTENLIIKEVLSKVDQLR